MKRVIRLTEINQKYGQYAVNKDNNFGQFKPLNFSK